MLIDGNTISWGDESSHFLDAYAIWNYSYTDRVTYGYTDDIRGQEIDIYARPRKIDNYLHCPINWVFV